MELFEKHPIKLVPLTGLLMTKHFHLSNSIFRVMDRDTDKTFNEYIDEKIGDRLTYPISIEEINEDWNMTLKDTFYMLGCITKYDIEFHPDYEGYIVIVNRVKMKAIKDKKSIQFD